MDKEKELVKFFQNNKGYTRILTLIFKKYKSLGKLTGTFELKDLTPEERRILAPLHHKYFEAKEAKVSIKKFVNYFCSGKIIEDVEEIYYSGDFDPEGIIIANKLKMRYGNKLNFWRFDIEDYLKVISYKKISSISKAKLDNIENSELSPLIEKIKEKGLAGYQELLIEDYIYDINTCIKFRN